MEIRLLEKVETAFLTKNLVLRKLNDTIVADMLLNSRFKEVVYFLRKRRKHKKDKWDEYAKIASCAFILAILFFTIIYLIDVTDSASKMGLVNADNSKDWLNFSISYFGSIAASFIGFIGAIMAVSITIEKQNEFRKEDNRKDVLPLVRVKADATILSAKNKIFPIIEYAGDGGTTLFISLSFKNVGQREMYDVWVGGVKYGSKESNYYCKILPILYVNEGYSDHLSSAIYCHPNEKFVNVSFKIYFKDCYDNWYYQEIIGVGTGDYGRSYKVDRFEIKSAPILVGEKGLPKAIK